jgi:diaminopimelate decarboxylase
VLYTGDLGFASASTENQKAIEPMLRRARKQIKQLLGPAIRQYRSGGQDLTPAHWGLTVTPSGQLACDDINLESLREKWGSPLHVVLSRRLRANAREFLAVNEVGRTRAEIYYSYKSNPVPGVLQLLHGLGIGAEVISEYELWLALKLGVPADRIVFNGPAKSSAAIHDAVARDLLLLNVNHREEIDVIATVARALGKRPRVGMRVAASTGWSGQFGLSIGQGEAFAAIKRVHETGVLQLTAIHCHAGGMLRSAQQVLGYVDEVLALADRVRTELSVELAILDFGGSLATPTVAGISELDRRLSIALQAPVPTPVPAATISIREYVQCVVEKVEAHYAATSRQCPRIFFEPGRSMTGNAQILITSVLSLNANVPKPGWAILDAGINLAESVRSEFHQIFPASRMHDERALRYRLAGPICSPGDVLSWAAPLPELATGDALAIMDAGAYFVPFSTSFSFPRPAIVMVDGSDVHLLRRAETFEDIIALDRVELPLTHEKRQALQ